MSTLTLKPTARRKVAARLGLTIPAPAHSQLSPGEAKQARRKAAERFHWRIAEDFPGVFCRPDHGPRVALAIGIDRSVAEHYPDVPGRTRNIFFVRYTRAPSYLALLQPGAPRIALDGGVTGAVTEAEAAHAAEKLEQLQARAAAPKRGEQ